MLQRAGLSVLWLDKSCLKGAAAEHFNHDNIFSSVLAVLGLHSQSVDQKLNIFSRCG